MSDQRYNDPYMNYIENEGIESRYEQYRDMEGRFTSPPKPSIERTTLTKDEDCACCGAPVMAGEVGYCCDVTFQFGCSEEHCREAAKAKLNYHESRPIVRN